ncbi:MAG: hypothetical protein GX611_09145 [Clostridiales bacterium]|nr:hypothetical protein [Clostridiales bacterium]
MSKQKKPRPPVPAWLSLDNAAKIYPAARTKGWMPLFRVSVTLTEEIDQALMQKALEQALVRVPIFGYRLRRGLFWYYLEEQKTLPRVEGDARNPMLPFNLTGGKRFMFRLRCHKRRVALEVFHALTDGYGAATFLLTLTAEYLHLKHGLRIPPQAMILDTREAPRREEREDVFPRVARDVTRSRREEIAWQLRGTREMHRYLRVVTGVMLTDRLLAVAREKKTTVNTLLAAVLLQALLKQKAASRRGRNKPVKLSLPVNLRKYYGADTLRNFSFYVNVPVHTGLGAEKLEDLITYVTHFMGLETMEQQLNARFSANVKAEQNKFLRVAPLFLKSLVLKVMYRATGERYITSTLTNLGNMKLPEEMARYVLRMDLVLGAAQKTPISAAVISAGGRTCFTFSKTMKQSGVERAFFTALVQLGVPVLIESN